jgi:hypothetical protein
MPCLHGNTGQSIQEADKSSPDSFPKWMDWSFLEKERLNENKMTGLHPPESLSCFSGNHLLFESNGFPVYKTCIFLPE